MIRKWFLRSYSAGEHPSEETLLMHVDGELTSRESARVRAHLETCWACRLALEKIEDSISTFVEFRQQLQIPLTGPPPGNWGHFDRKLNQLSSSTPIENSSWLSRYGRSLQNVFFLQGVNPFPGRWRILAIPAVLVLLFSGLIVWLGLSPSTTISASEILSENERRAELWYRQPDKVLHWSWETTLVNNPQLPDGKYRSLHWLNNTDGRSLRLIRRYDENGVLIWATWSRPDGSEVVYSRLPKDEIAVYPTTDALRAYAAGLNEGKRKTAERYIELSEKLRQIDVSITTRKQALDFAFDNASVQVIQDSDIGKVFRIKLVSKPAVGEKVSAAETEVDIAADTFIKHRSRSVKHYSDGKISVEDAKLAFYREASVEEFNSNDLRKELGQGKKITHVTPETVLKHVTPETLLWMAEAVEKGTRTYQPAK